ncbi:Alpha/beta hydrolase family protein [Roseimaritima multifibrata]|uniref:Alpha/beta hydrolase family protein n=1 Tax=Roseimaritima multifibrata TaxID=1930274 RepID=A0A517MB39_9BACT|nr:GDSL-type esterase/lipase family protein [Roseimaritima multifibrata]QDS92086.1 Alpha/beta hydrolase family protein [Roseimaritima multifibrata]
MTVLFQSRCRLFALTLLVLGILGGFATIQAAEPVVAPDSETTAKRFDWKGTESKWEGFKRFDFQVDQHKAYVVAPETVAPGAPWVWRARFPGFHAEADKILLDRGFHVAHIDTANQLGSPRAMKTWDAFYQAMVSQGLAKQVALEGVSRGGLFVYAFAAQWPDRVACIYCDTPVCDMKSWPGGKGKGVGSASTWKTCLAEYGFSEAEALAYQGNPIDRLETIAAAKIPILHIVSLTDRVVPPEENTFILADRYRKLGGQMDIIEVAEGTEKSQGHHFTHPDPVRVADFIEAHATVLPNTNDYFELRGSLDNSRIQFERNKKGRVAFMGGSITEMKGWRERTQAYLRSRFPETEFEFIDAGISSTGSTPGSFRLMRDVLAAGDIDLFFEEAAVNDKHNFRQPTEIVRGMEGILRHARRANPKMDIVVMQFVDPYHMTDYRNGQTPKVIEQHQRVAKHYDVPTIQLAKEVTERIDANQFTWKEDFRDLHPSDYGHRLYASTIRRLLSTAWEPPLRDTATAVDHNMPQPIDPFSYDRGTMVPLESATDLQGFRIDPKCDPRANDIGGGVRKRFHDVPMLVGTSAGDSFALKFSGRGVGIFVAAGPDAGKISYQVDGGETKHLDLFTKWSGGLHIPWVHVLESELPEGEHVLRIQIDADHNEASKGTACRIVNLLVNE